MAARSSSLSPTTPPPAEARLVETQLVRAHAIAAFVTLFLALGFGYHAAKGLSSPGSLDAYSKWLSWGKMRFDHTQGILFGWLANAFFAFLYHAVPILTGRRVFSPRLGQWIFGVWNFAVVVPGWILVLAGFSQPLEWAEFPLVIDAFALLALSAAAVQFLPSFFARGLEDLYVSSWYILGGLVFTLLAYPMGNFVPELLPGARGALFSGLWIHDAIGLFVTPLALAVIYYVIPASSGRPIYSHFLSMLGFWLLFFLYPLNGTHHYVYSVIPMSAQMGAIAASTLLGVDVVLVVANLLLSLRGSGLFPRDPALRFVSTSTVFYLLVSLQGSLQAQMGVNRLIHFSDWVVGHSHLAMAGFATFAACGGLLHAWQRLPGAKFNLRLVNWAYWLMLVGLVTMVADLTVAGLKEAASWSAGEPWIASVAVAMPYWFLRTLTIVPLGAGFALLFVGLLTGPRAEVPAVAQPEPEAEVAPAGARALRMSYLVAGVGGIGFFAMSILLLGLWPAKALEAEIARQQPGPSLALTSSELRGRAIYAREGCAYCHTQQVRYVDDDVARYGAATLAWETNLDYPHLWGTRRIGPDLSRESGVRSLDWHLVHLYSPQALSVGTVMPAYPHLFAQAPDRPTQDALDLVAYLETLGRARALAGAEGEKKARTACRDCDADTLRQAFAAELNAHPSKPRRDTRHPALSAQQPSANGESLFLRLCANCHGTRTSQPLASGLLPKPADFLQHEYTLEALGEILWNGRIGTAMPSFRDLGTDELAGIANTVRNQFRPQLEPAIPQATLDLGAKVYREHCIQCHGDRGAGDGPAAKEFAIQPPNLRQQRPTISAALEAVRNGVPGTPMAPWATKLTEPEVSAATYYIRTFFPGGER